MGRVVAAVSEYGKHLCVWKSSGGITRRFFTVSYDPSLASQVLKLSVGRIYAVLSIVALFAVK